MAEKFYWEGENLCAVYNVKCIPFEISKKNLMSPQNLLTLISEFKNNVQCKTKLQKADVFI